MWPRCTAPMTIISPNPASKDWRGPCARRLRSMRARRTKFRRRKVRSAGKSFAAACSQRAAPAGTERNARSGKRAPMAIYTVHEPPLKGDQTQPDPERFAFVRDGFSFWAYLLTPLWMLRHRLWLVL